MMGKLSELITRLDVYDLEMSVGRVSPSIRFCKKQALWRKVCVALLRALSQGDKG